MQSLQENPMLSTLHVSELANRAGVTPTTIRYYARIGILKSQREVENGYRCFQPVDVKRVEFVRKAQALGLKIGDIKAIFESVDQGNAPCQQVRSLVASRFEEIERQIAELTATKARMKAALGAWGKQQAGGAKTSRFCPLIEQTEIDTAESHSAIVSVN